MEYAELKIIALNVVIILFAYLFLYPRTAGSNALKIAAFDILATGTALVIVGSVFWGTGQMLSLVIFKANWFWFTLITYMILELPMMQWYFKKNNVSFPDDI